MEFTGRTTGTVTEVKKIWWIKVKLKAVRLHSEDGVAFPHNIKVKYTVDGREYYKKVYIPWRILPPPKGAEVTVSYDENRPQRSMVGFGGSK
ncbi:MAG: sugar ABC transporter permease [Ruminococcaceae bacterium]|nr:sugar ABC transporter permease [Oscillospiraceae bacterium]